MPSICCNQARGRDIAAIGDCDQISFHTRRAVAGIPQPSLFRRANERDPTRTLFEDGSCIRQNWQGILMVSDELTDDLAATVATKFEQLDFQKLEEYRNLVGRCLTEIFGKTEREARISIGILEDRGKSLTEENMILLYHNSPLQIAANLAGASSRPLTTDEKLKYIAIINEKRDDRPEMRDLQRAYPDDLP
jgi:hypothetical protein